MVHGTLGIISIAPTLGEGQMRVYMLGSIIQRRGYHYLFLHKRAILGGKMIN